MARFRLNLATEKDIILSRREAIAVLNTIPEYLKHLLRKKTGERRVYYVHSVGECWQMDIMFYKHNSTLTPILMIIDLYSRRVFGHPLSNKTAKVVREALQLAFDDYGYLPLSVSVDRGSEFIGNTKFLEEKGIRVTWKYG